MWVGVTVKEFKDILKYFEDSDKIILCDTVFIDNHKVKIAPTLSINKKGEAIEILTFDKYT